MNQQAPAYIDAPINLDRAIQELQKALVRDCPWITVAFGRARLIPEKTNGKILLLPKVYYGEKEYVNVLLNDTVPAQSWFQTLGIETPLNYGMENSIQKMQSTVSLIVWLNFTKLQFDQTQDYYWLEFPKRDVFNCINKYPNVTITKISDENAKDIFKEYTTEVERDQFLTHPKGALRFDFLLTYNLNAIGCP